MKTLFDEWQGYRRDVVPPHAPAIQVEECRRAFYARLPRILDADSQ